MQLQRRAADHDGLVNDGVAGCLGQAVEMARGVLGKAVAHREQADGLGWRVRCEDGVHSGQQAENQRGAAADKEAFR